MDEWIHKTNLDNAKRIATDRAPTTCPEDPASG